MIAEREALGHIPTGWQHHKSNQGSCMSDLSATEPCAQGAYSEQRQGPEYDCRYGTGVVGTDGPFEVICSRCIKKLWPIAS